ncbi:MAG: serine O-acetyltransferase [Pyrinomonadaceae bacterium]
MNEQINKAVETLLASYAATESHVSRLEKQPPPATGEIVRVVQVLQELMFPGFFGTQGLSGETLRQDVARKMVWLCETLNTQIGRACVHGDDIHETSRLKTEDIASEFLLDLPRIRKILATDVKAAYDGDPAATCLDEVIASYPSVYAMMTYRLAHVLHKLDVPLIPRIMSEHAHALTGIDIHPATQIGEAFFIDHGTGVVIGGTAVIGNRVKIYQGVTLGAFSFLKDADGKLIRNTKRHPTIEDDVVIYSGATILGGDTVIGKGSAIGGNVWLTKSVPPYTKVYQDTPRLRIITPESSPEQGWDYVI